MSLAGGEELRAFKAAVPLRKYSTHDNRVWSYFDCGPKDAPPLVCIPGTSGTATMFYRQMTHLSCRGYRVIAVNHPVVWTHEEWAQSFDRFLAGLRLDKVHLLAHSLGGFLAQVYTTLYPARVRSIVLCNSFCSTRYFYQSYSCVSLLPLSPQFVLRKYVTDSLVLPPDGSPAAEAMTFALQELDTLSQPELASRLTLNATLGASEEIRVPLPDSALLLLDAHGPTSLPDELREQLRLKYPSVKEALIRAGGDFPFLTQAAEVALHLVVHLRNQGVAGVQAAGDAGDGAEAAAVEEDATDAGCAR